MPDLIIAPNADSNFVSLSSGSASSLKLSRSVKGKLFKKHILSTGPLYYNGVAGGKVDITEDTLKTIVENFEKKVCPIVQVPIVGDDNSHTEDPLRNIGEVVGLSVENGKLYSIIDARDDLAAQKLGKTLIGASAMISLNRTDNRTSKKAGPTLIHVAITNNPHVNELDDFEEVLAASSDDSTSSAVMLSTTPDNEETVMDLDTLISTAREEHGIDIPALQRAAAEAESFAKLSADLQNTLTGSEVLKLSNDEGFAAHEDIVSAVAQLAEERVELSNKVNTLVEESRRSKAEARIDTLVSEGFIVPAKREAQLNLLLSNSELFEELLPEKPIVELSAESGQDVLDPAPDKTIEEEIARLSADAEKQGLSVKS